ncbi:MAG: signal peptidase I [Verrucomicrobia bacterium]|nr:signal peptidase I [Verrucomicrobiota bacterium]
MLFIVQLVIIVLIVAGFWKVFTKASQPGWAAIIPIYNLYILLKIVGRPAWWLILFLVPIVNLVIAVLVALDVAKSFGKGTGFGIGLFLLGFIFYPILGFGDAVYGGPSVAPKAPPPAPPAA